MSSVLLVSHQQLFRVGAIALLEGMQDVCVVGEASSGFEAVQWMKANYVDVILMEIHLPQMSGLEATKRILSTRHCQV
ncbi:MAG: response regulator [Gammaproteobacteria bacterium]|nr:response regulator [Gammaproteobacteria bacterium]